MNYQQSFRDATLPPPSSRILCTVDVVIHQERFEAGCKEVSGTAYRAVTW